MKKKLKELVEHIIFVNVLAQNTQGKVFELMDWEIGVFPVDACKKK